MGKELNNLRGEKVTISVKGEEREIRFGFSAWAILEKEYNGIKNLEKLQKQVEERPFETLPHLIYIGLVNKEGVEEATVLDDYGIAGIEEVSEKFAQALYGSLPDAEKKAVMEAK